MDKHKTQRKKHMLKLQLPIIYDATLHLLQNAE